MPGRDHRQSFGGDVDRWTEPDACPRCGHPMADHYGEEGGCVHAACDCEEVSDAR